MQMSDSSRSSIVLRLRNGQAQRVSRLESLGWLLSATAAATSARPLGGAILLVGEFHFLVMTMNSRCVCDETLRARIEAEYREMPGLSLTAAQAGRLWALDGACCTQVLAELMDAGFLRCSADGRYRRNTGEDVCHWRRRVEMTGAGRTANSQEGLTRAKTPHPSQSSSLLGTFARLLRALLPLLFGLTGRFCPAK